MPVSSPLGTGIFPSRDAALPTTLATFANTAVLHTGHMAGFFFARMSRTSLKRTMPGGVSGLGYARGVEQLKHTQLHSFSITSKNW